MDGKTDKAFHLSLSREMKVRKQTKPQLILGNDKFSSYSKALQKHFMIKKDNLQGGDLRMPELGMDILAFKASMTDNISEKVNNVIREQKHERKLLLCLLFNNEEELGRISTIQCENPTVSTFVSRDVKSVVELLISYSKGKKKQKTMKKIENDFLKLSLNINEVGLNVLMQIPEISEMQANIILQQFQSLKNIANADEKTIQGLTTLTEEQSKNIVKFLNESISVD